MLGKASDIKTYTIYETQHQKIHEAINAMLQEWRVEIIDIKYSSTLVGQRYWGSALIIYKEV